MAVRDPVNVLTANVAVQKVVAGRGTHQEKIAPLSYKNAIKESTVLANSQL